MQIIEIELSHSNFYCPVTGEVISDEDAPPMNENAKSLMGFWIDAVLEEPIINDKILKSSWNRYVKKFEKESGEDYPDCADLRKFLADYKNPTWIVFEITSSGIGHGIHSDTVWYVIDMETRKTKK